MPFRQIAIPSAMECCIMDFCHWAYLKRRQCFFVSLANQYRRERLLLGGLFGFCLIGRAVGRPIGSVGQPIRTDVAAAAFLALLMGVLFGFVAF